MSNEDDRLLTSWREWSSADYDTPDAEVDFALDAAYSDELRVAAAAYYAGWHAAMDTIRHDLKQARFAAVYGLSGADLERWKADVRARFREPGPQTPAAPSDTPPPPPAAKAKGSS